MSSQITQNQLIQLKQLRDQATSSTNVDTRIGLTVHILQILKDTNPLSAFANNLFIELTKFELRREDYPFGTILAIINNAINYYEVN